MNSEDLRNFLIKYKKKENEKITHTVIPDIKNKVFGMALSIPSEEIEIVYDKLCNLYFKSKKNLSLTESFGEYCPLIIDIDLKYKDSKQKRYYTDETIIKLVNF